MPATSTRGSARTVLLVAVAAAMLPVALITGAATAATSDTRVFGSPVVVDADDANSVAEPSIEVAADGAIYVSGPQGLPGARLPAVVPGTGAVPGAGGDLAWRSDDGGKTFTFLGSYDGTLGGGDSDIVSAPNGDLYASGLNLACIAISSSTDRGDSWTTNPAGCTDGGGLADRQWNDVDGNDAVYTGYGTMTQGLVLQKSETTAADGVVVNGPTTVVNGGDYQWPGVVSVDQKTGNAVMAWNTSGSDTVKDLIQVNGVNRAGDLLFTAPKTVATAEGDTFDSFVSIDHGADGSLYAVWSERRPTLKETWTMLAVSRDGGTTWAAPVHVDTTPATTVFPWVSAGDAGRVAVTYYGTSSTGTSPEALDVKDAPWQVWSSFSTDYGKTFTEYQTTSTPMHKGSICTSGTGCATGTRDLLDFFETDADPSGCLVTVFTDNSRDVVAANGTRTSDAATRIEVVRQTSGPGLKTTGCDATKAVASASPSASGSASSTPSASSSASASASASTTASASATASATARPTSTSSATATATSSTGSSPSCPTTPTAVTVNTRTINATGLASVTVTGAQPGALVELQGYSQNHYGTNGFDNDASKVDRSGTADARGAVTFDDLRLASNTRMRARQAGCTYGDSSVVDVRATETLQVARQGVRSYVVSGTSIPARPGGLIVSLYRITGQACAAGVNPSSCPGETFLGQARADARTGEYAIPVRFPARDDHVRDEFVVKTGRDAQNAPGRSNVRSLLIY